MKINTLSLSKAIISVHGEIGFSFETKDTISDSLDTVKINGDTKLDRSAIILKYDEFESIRPLNDLREVRNSLISETDWWASSDLTMTEEQINYRQALRDITNTYTSLDNVIWPDKPQ